MYSWFIIDISESFAAYTRNEYFDLFAGTYVNSLLRKVYDRKLLCFRKDASYIAKYTTVYASFSEINNFITALNIFISISLY